MQAARLTQAGSIPRPHMQSSSKAPRWVQPTRLCPSAASAPRTLPAADHYSISTACAAVNPKLHLSIKLTTALSEQRFASMMRARAHRDGCAEGRAAGPVQDGDAAPGCKCHLLAVGRPDHCPHPGGRRLEGLQPHADVAYKHTASCGDHRAAQAVPGGPAGPPGELHRSGNTHCRLEPQTFPVHYKHSWSAAYCMSYADCIPTSTACCCRTLLLHEAGLPALPALQVEAARSQKTARRSQAAPGCAACTGQQWRLWPASLPARARLATGSATPARCWRSGRCQPPQQSAQATPCSGQSAWAWLPQHLPALAARLARRQLRVQRVSRCWEHNTALQNTFFGGL